MYTLPFHPGPFSMRSMLGSLSHSSLDLANCKYLFEIEAFDGATLGPYSPQHILSAFNSGKLHLDSRVKLTTHKGFKPLSYYFHLLWADDKDKEKERDKDKEKIKERQSASGTAGASSSSADLSNSGHDHHDNSNNTSFPPSTSTSEAVTPQNTPSNGEQQPQPQQQQQPAESTESADTPDLTTSPSTDTCAGSSNHTKDMPSTITQGHEEAPSSTHHEHEGEHMNGPLPNGVCSETDDQGTPSHGSSPVVAAEPAGVNSNDNSTGNNVAMDGVDASQTE